MSRVEHLERAADLLGDAIANLQHAARSSKVRLLPGVDSDAEWRRRLAAIDLRLARFYLGIFDDRASRILGDELADTQRRYRELTDGLSQELDEAIRTVESVH